MIFRTLHLSICLLTTCILSCSKTSDDEQVSLTGAMPRDQAENIKSMVGFDTLNKMSLGPWECYAPKEALEALLFCTFEGKSFVTAMNTGSFEVWVPKSSKEQVNFITIIDRDKDGNFEQLRYDGTSKDGELLRVVHDDNLDGNIDRYLDAIQRKSFFNVEGKWYEGTTEKGKDGKYKQYINIEGKKNRIIWTEFPYKLVEEEND